ncbi:MAG: T9SS type A sorting domain-containing protein [Saprospiraceae bacterium]
MKILKLILLVFSGLLLSNSIFAYGRTVPLSDRVQNAELVFEGKIVDRESFWNETHTRIFTKNTVAVSRMFKGEPQQFIEIISQGGIVGNDFEFISHATSFELDAEGVFFCKNFTTHHNDHLLMINGMSGFIVYDRQLHETYTNYKYFTRKELIRNLALLANGGQENSEDVTGVEYSIQNVSLSGNVLDFDIYVEGLWGSYDLTESELLIEYDPTVLGQNVQSNGVLSISPGVVSSSPNYSLSVNDVNPDRVSINVKALNTGFTLYTISSVPEQLVHVQIVSPSFGNPDIEFDEAGMQQLSEYLDANSGIKAFQQVFAVGSINDIGGALVTPQITGFSPDTVKAGTGDILTITGTDFGATKGQVKFPNADDGGQTYTQTPTGDILTWTPTMITVRVPSQFGGSNPAGTGRFVVETAASQIDTSGTELEVLFAIGNSGNTISKPIYLADAEDGDGAEDGTWTFSIDTTINNNPNIKATVEQALCDWNILTNIEWTIDTISNKNSFANFDSTNLIYFASANQFTGSSVGATAYTRVTGGLNATVDNCPLQSNPSQTVFYLREVDIVIREDLSTIPNNQATGGYNFNMNTAPNANQMDFYSIILHELGHTQLLKHALDINKLMYYRLTAGTQRRDITYADFKGGEYMITEGNKADSLGFCPVPINRQLICVVSTQKVSEDYKVNIFPNPFSSQLTVSFQTKEFTKNAEVSIFNLLGQKVYQKQIGSLTTGEHNIILNPTERLSDGLYLVILQLDENTLGYKILKQ